MCVEPSLSPDGDALGRDILELDALRLKLALYRSSRRLMGQRNNCGTILL
jgi:hypothetical protein